MYEDFADRLSTAIWSDFGVTPGREEPQPAITDISTFVVDGNFPWTIVRLETDAGVTGIGEAYPSPGVHQIIQEFFGPVLAGENPLDVERLYNLMRETHSGRGSQWGVATIAISGVELALWDAAGKLLDQPVYQLLGGKTRESVRIYADCHAGENMVEAALDEPADAYTPEAYAAAARDAVDDGFDFIKFDLDVPSGRDIDTTNGHFDPVEIEHKRSLVEAAVEEVAGEAEVAFDLHWNYPMETAERMCRALEDIELAWVEDPLPPENADAMAQLNRAVDVPILTGENLYGRHGFRELIENDAAGFVAPDIPKTGGIAETKKIAEYADTHYQTIAPHNIGSPIATMAGVHLGAVLPNFLALEYHAREVPWWDDLYKQEEPLIQNGRIQVPDAPGLGIELDWSTVDAHRID